MHNHRRMTNVGAFLEALAWFGGQSCRPERETKVGGGGLQVEGAAKAKASGQDCVQGEARRHW